MKFVKPMAKALFALTALSFSFSSLEATINSDVYQSIYNRNSIAKDHTVAFDELFRLVKPNTLSVLQFGLGDATEYLLSSCKQITSIQISIPSQAAFIDSAFSQAAQRFKRWSNWTPFLFKASALIDYYNDQYSQGHQTRIRSAQYRKDVQDITNFGLSKGTFEVALVDPALLTRAEFVNSLFRKIDIIIAHDTIGQPEHGRFDWIRVYDDENYEKIVFANGTGTTIWVNINKPELIEQLKKAASKYSK